MISVIVPMYNCEKTITRCIESVLKQTYTDFELILINNASTDNTLKITEAYKNDCRISILNENNPGVSYARNCGIENAHGEYLTFLDSDDYVENDFLEEMISKAGNYDLTVCNFFVENEKNAATENALPMPNTEYVLKENIIEDYLMGNFGKSIGFCVWNKLFSLKLIKDNNVRFSTKVRIGEDKIFVLSYLLSGCKRVNLLNKSLYHYIIFSSSAMNNANTDYLKEYEKTMYEITEILRIRGYNDSVLSRVALEDIIVYLGSRKIAKMQYKEFKHNIKLHLYNSNHYFLIVKNKNFSGYKRKILSFLIRYKLTFLIYMAVKKNFK